MKSLVLVSSRLFKFETENSSRWTSRCRTLGATFGVIGQQLIFLPNTHHFSCGNSVAIRMIFLAAAKIEITGHCWTAFYPRTEKRKEKQRWTLYLKHAYVPRIWRVFYALI